MKKPDRSITELQALRERLSGLTEASLRTNESLDFNTVLNGVLDSARSLTGAHYGVMTLLDESDSPEEFYSSGMRAEKARKLWFLPAGMRLYEYLSRIRTPLRHPDLRGLIRSLGLPEFQPPVTVGPAVSFLAAPVFHRDELVGNIYLAKKEAGGEFTQEDEETLVMFASQAALVIANARRYRDEQRARTDLETLIDTSPVGVAVFDAGTGLPVSLNREASRIVDCLRKPDQSPEHLLQDLTLRRGDGQEIFLEEVSLSQVMSAGETVRAEQMVRVVPDGRSITTLINATPIPSADGRVASFVVTLQDLTPLEELECLRADFLSMVSHDLRVPLTSIRGSATALLDAADLEPAVMTQFHRIIVEQSDSMLQLIDGLLDVARIRTGTLPVAPEPTELAGLVDRARNIFLGGGGRNPLDIDLAADLPLVMADRQRIVQVIGNLLSNAAKYSPESSPIRVTAVRQEVRVAVSVADQGRGIPAGQLPHLFGKFSRTGGGDGARETGGAGLGLAICKGIVEAHGGRIRAESDGPGRGARFTFTIPAVQEAAAPLPSTPRQKPGDRTRILVVDDDPQTLAYVQHELSEAGFEPVVTADPDQVLALMKDNRPHLVLLDLVLPGSDGIELMKDLLAMADLPVIFLSGYGSDQVISRAFENGAADYIVKPFSPTELVARVRAALRRREAGAWAQPGEPYVLGRADRRLCRTPRHPGRTCPEADRGRVRTALRVVRQLRAGGHLQPVAEKSLGGQALGRSAQNPNRRQKTAPQAQRRRGQPHLPLYGAGRRIPDAQGTGTGSGVTGEAGGHKVQASGVPGFTQL